MKKLLILLLLIPLLGFSQLATTNLTMTAIKTALSESTFALSLLDKSTEINKWSLKKPVVTDGSPDWWNYTGTNITYSILQTPLTGGLDGLAYDEDSDWTLQRPTTDYKMGWYRGYLDTATPSVITSAQPTGDVRGTSPDWSQIVTTTGASNITVANLGYDTYYYGILIEWGASWVNKYVLTNSTTLASGAVDIPFVYQMLPFSPSYTGTYRWTSFICSQEINDGTGIEWQTLAAAQTEHTGEVVLVTDAWSTYSKSGTFTNPYGSITAAGGLDVAWQSGESDGVSVDVEPVALTTTSTVEDTGDGIFVTITAGATATGDFTLTVESTSANTGEAPRTCQIRIISDVGDTPDELVGVVQQQEPVKPIKPIKPN